MRFDVFQRDLVAGTTVRLAADDPAGGFDVIGSDVTPTGLVVSLLTRADLLPEQNVGATLIDRLPADTVFVSVTATQGSCAHRSTRPPARP